MPEKLDDLLLSEPEQGKLCDDVKEPPDKRDLEGEKVYICFYYYKDKECQIKELDASPAKKALQRIRDIGKLKALDFGSFNKGNLHIKKIERVGNYRKLYYELPAEEELYEIDISNSGRIFFFMVQNVCYIVVIKNKHVET